MELPVEEPSIPRRNISCSLQGILSERPSLSSSEYCVCVARPCHRHQNTLCFSPPIEPCQSDNKGRHNQRAPPYYEPWSVQFQSTSIPLSLTCLPRFALLPAAAQSVNKRRVAANGQMWRDHNVNIGEIKPSIGRTSTGTERKDDADRFSGVSAVGIASRPSTPGQRKMPGSGPKRDFARVISASKRAEVADAGSLRRSLRSVE
jgi:hypothetical protein